MISTPNKRMKNSPSQFFYDYRSQLNTSNLFWALLIFIGLLFIGFLLDKIIPADQFWKSNVLSGFAALSSSVVIYFVWELGAKKTFTREIMELTNLSNNIVDSGIDYYYDNFKDIDWKPLLCGQKELVICITYGAWIYKRIESDLETFIQGGGKITLYLPDPKNDKIVSALADRFKKPEDDIKGKINKAIESFEKLDTEIFLFEGTYQSSYYLIGDMALMSFFNHSIDNRTVPALLLGKNGKMHKYVLEEIEAIKSRSRKYESEKNEKSI